MTEQERASLAAEHLIFVALLKAISEHSTFLTGFYQRGMKQDFNQFINRADDLIKKIESSQSEDAKQYIQSVTDVYHNITLELRTQSKERYLDVLQS